MSGTSRAQSRMTEWKLKGGCWHLYERRGRKMIPATALKWVYRKGRKVQIRARVCVDPVKALTYRLAGVAVRTPEARLMLAIIEQAAKDLQLRDVPRTKPGPSSLGGLNEDYLDYLSARDFFRRGWFIHICEAIGIQPSGVIRAARQLGVIQPQDAI